MKKTTIDEFFNEMLPARLSSGIEELQDVEASFEFTFTGGAPQVWALALSKEGATLEQKNHEDANCKIKIDSEVFEAILNDELSAEEAFMQGKLALEGDMSLAMKLGALFAVEGEADEAENLPPFQPLPVDTPALVVYIDALKENLKTMHDFARGQGVRVRPHVKSHKTVELARMQLEAGANGFCCAKVGEAEVLADAGIGDILIANQVVTENKIRRVIKTAKSAKITVAVDSEKNVADLQRIAADEGVTLPVLIEINVGMNRCGVLPGDACAALARAVAEAPDLKLDGIMGYEGHVVMMNDRDARGEGAKKANAILIEARDCIAGAGFPVSIVSAGGTGTFDMTGVHPGVTEIQVGSYVFMDARYRRTGVPFKNSLFLIATVISKPRPDLAIIDAGLKSISSEFGMPEIRRPGGMRLAFLSEEHADVVVSGGDFDIGDQVEIMPSHCCTTINLHDKLHVVKDGKVENVWDIEARGKSV